MSLLAFMRHMTEHPDELKAYKQDPQAFFDKHHDIALTDDEQRAVQGFPHISTHHEATTVMRLSLTFGQGLADNANTALPAADKSVDDHIPLGGVQVYVYAHSEAHVFFAEPSQFIGPVPCITLPHSYLLINEQTKYFDLHLCYTDPEDTSDRVQVLYITTEGDRPSNITPYMY